MDLELEVNSDQNVDSESEMWEQFDFPQLTTEEDAQLTIALQGTNTSELTTSIETITLMAPQEAMVDHSHVRSGVQGPTDQGATESEPSSSPLSPPPYMTAFSENNNSQSSNRYFLINNHSVVPMSSNGQIYIVVDGVYHVIRQM